MILFSGLQSIFGRDDLSVIPPLIFHLSLIRNSLTHFHAKALAHFGLGLYCVIFLKEAHCGQEVVRRQSDL